MELEKFKIIFMPLRDKLQNIARNILSDAEEAEDAVQETYLRIWTVRDQLDQHPNVEGFTMQTLKNICIDKLRAKKTNVPIDHANVECEISTPYSQTERNDSIRIVKQIIDTLPELQRKIMWMRDVDGYELEEIAQIIGSGVAAVTMNLSRARKRVRDRFLNVNKTLEQKI